MKYLYIVDYWKEFPHTEYGGMCLVIAANHDECVELIKTGVEEDATLHPLIAPKVFSAKKFELKDIQESEVVDYFFT